MVLFTVFHKSVSIAHQADKNLKLYCDASVQTKNLQLHKFRNLKPLSSIEKNPILIT